MILIGSGKVAAQTTPPTEFVAGPDGGYYKVRPDVFDSLTVWAQQHEHFVELSYAQDSLAFVLREGLRTKQEEARLLSDLLKVEKERSAFYREAGEKQHWLVKVWNKLEFPMGVALGGYIAIQVAKYD